MPLFLIFPLIRFCYDMLCTLILMHISGSLLISLSLVVNRTIMALDIRYVDNGAIDDNSVDNVAVDKRTIDNSRGNMNLNEKLSQNKKYQPLSADTFL